jgi:hypothetical protein
MSSDPNFKVFQSSNLQSGRYDPLSGTLTLEFVNGRRYVSREPVPSRVWSTLYSAVQPKQYFDAYIKPAFSFREITDANS